MNLWNELNHLFQNEHDDGTLPDIFVENISPEKSVEIYIWVMSLTKPYGNPTLWSLEEERDIEIAKISNPALHFIQGRSEGFRHGLEEFEFSGVKIPQLSIALNEDGLEFDYRMGRDWGANELEALFEFLFRIKRLAPSAEITQAHEGGYDKRNVEFSDMFDAYVAKRKVS